MQSPHETFIIYRMRNNTHKTLHVTHYIQLNLQFHKYERDNLIFDVPIQLGLLIVIHIFLKIKAHYVRGSILRRFSSIALGSRIPLEIGKIILGNIDSITGAVSKHFLIIQ